MTTVSDLYSKEIAHAVIIQSKCYENHGSSTITVIRIKLWIPKQRVLAIESDYRSPLLVKKWSRNFETLNTIVYQTASLAE